MPRKTATIGPLVKVGEGYRHGSKTKSTIPKHSIAESRMGEFVRAKDRQKVIAGNEWPNNTARNVPRGGGGPRV